MRKGQVMLDFLTRAKDKIWQAGGVVLGLLALWQYIGKRKAQSETQKIEKVLADAKLEQMKNDSDKTNAIIAETIKQNTLAEQAQERINEAAEGKDLKQGADTQKKPVKGSKITIGCLLLFFMVSCTPKVVVQTEYITLKPSLPYLNIIEAPAFTPVDFYPLEDGDVYYTGYDNVTALAGYVEALKDIISRHNAQAREYNKFRSELINEKSP